MPGYRLSKLARLDLIAIGDYTVDHWGADQAVRYLDSLERYFGLIAANLQIGRRCDRLRRGYRRIEHEKHVIFYRNAKEGVLIVCVLHQRILPDNQSMDDPE